MGAFCHVTLKVAYKMYPQRLIKNNIMSTPSITEKNILCEFILLWSLYRYHTQRNLILFHWLFWTIHSIMRLNMMLSRTSCFHKLKYPFQGHKHGFKGVPCTSVAWYHIRPFVLYYIYRCVIYISEWIVPQWPANLSGVTHSTRGDGS